MICYVDASVLLRVILEAPERLPEWPSVDEGVSSELLRVECRRALYRVRSLDALDDERLVTAFDASDALYTKIEFAVLNRAVLRRASDLFPTPLGTLDAIHLATALLWQDDANRPLDAFLTHDLELGRAARAMGLRVLGC